jgi:hypothetical protein
MASLEATEINGNISRSEKAAKAKKVYKNKTKNHLQGPDSNPRATGCDDVPTIGRCGGRPKPARAMLAPMASSSGLARMFNTDPKNAKSQNKATRANLIYPEEKRWRRHLTHLHIVCHCLRTTTSSGGPQLLVHSTLEPGCRLRVGFVVRHILCGDRTTLAHFLSLHLLGWRGDNPTNNIRILKARVATHHVRKRVSNKGLRALQALLPMVAAANSQSSGPLHLQNRIILGFSGTVCRPPPSALLEA